MSVLPNFLWQPFGEETDGDLERQTKTPRLGIYILCHHHRVDCFGRFVRGANGFGKQTEGNVLLLSCIQTMAE